MIAQIRDQDHIKAYMNLRNKMSLKFTCHVIKFFALCSKLDRHKTMTPVFINHWVDLFQFHCFIFELS